MSGVLKLKADISERARKFEEIVDEAQNATAMIVAFAQNKSAQSQESLSEIASSLNLGNYLRAERLSKERLEAYPEDDAALFFLGISLYRMGRIDEAITALQKAGFATPKDQSSFSCWSGRLLGLISYDKWLSTHTALDFRNAYQLLRSTLNCPGDIRSEARALSLDQRPIERFSAVISSETETAQRNALDRLADLSGKWTDKGGTEYKLQHQGNVLTINWTYRPGGAILLQSFNATLNRSGSRLMGTGRSTFVSTMASCDWDFEISLELSEDLEYLKGTWTVTKWSGRNKDFCQGVAGRLQNEILQLRRK